MKLSTTCFPHSAFEECREIEALGVQDLVQHLKLLAHEGRFVLTDKGTLSFDLQKSYGDALANTSNGKIWAIEFKVEEQNKHDNFFLETWSNLKRFTVGWMIVLRADLLWYYFQKEKQLYSIPFNRLREWAFRKQRIYAFPEKCQTKYEQLNDTWGRCVPISTIQNEVGFRYYSLGDSHK